MILDLYNRVYVNSFNDLLWKIQQKKLCRFQRIHSYSFIAYPDIILIIVKCFKLIFQ